MGGGDSGYGIGLLWVTSNKLAIPQTEQHSPFGLMLLGLGNVICEANERIKAKVLFMHCSLCS